jgi:hypothetical protein
VPKNTRYSTRHFDGQKASDLLAFRRAISGGLFRTPGRKVASPPRTAPPLRGRASRHGALRGVTCCLSESDCRTAHVLPREGPWRVEYWRAVRHRVRPRTNPDGSAESGRGIRRGIPRRRRPVARLRRPTLPQLPPGRSVRRQSFVVRGPRARRRSCR